jgi:hypothetical protein
LTPPAGDQVHRSSGEPQVGRIRPARSLDPEFL